MPDVEKFFNAERTKKAKQAFKLMFQPVPNYSIAQPILQGLADEWRSQGTIDEFKKTLSLAAKILGSNPPPATIGPAINTAATNVSQALKLAKQVKKASTPAPQPYNKNVNTLENLNTIMEQIRNLAKNNTSTARIAMSYRTMRGAKHLEKNRNLNTEKKYGTIWNEINLQKAGVSQPPHTASSENKPLTRIASLLKQSGKNPSTSK